jgi:hypothetical protein
MSFASGMIIICNLFLTIFAEGGQFDDLVIWRFRDLMIWWFRDLMIW